MDIKIQIGDYEVLNTGTTIALEGVPILFTIGELKISFVFITKQEDDAEMTINKRVISSKEAVIEFTNFDAQLGSGLVTPFVVGSFQNKEFSFLARFSQLNKGGKLVNYTWLVREYSIASQKGVIPIDKKESK